MLLGAPISLEGEYRVAWYSGPDATLQRGHRQANLSGDPEPVIKCLQAEECSARLVCPLWFGDNSQLLGHPVRARRGTGQLARWELYGLELIGAGTSPEKVRGQVLGGNLSSSP